MFSGQEEGLWKQVCSDIIKCAVNEKNTLGRIFSVKNGIHYVSCLVSELINVILKVTIRCIFEVL